MEDGALLYATATDNNGVPLLKCSGALSVRQGASLFLNLPTRGSSPLLYFSTAANVEFNSPKTVVLYSNGGKVFSFAGGTAKQINYWTAAKTPFTSAGGFDDAPLLSFRKADGEAAAITQKTTSSAAVSPSSNLAEGNPGYPVSASLDFTQAAVLSQGELDVKVDDVSDLSAFVTGTTAPNAAVEYSDSAQSISDAADGIGAFSLPLTVKPAPGVIRVGWEESKSVLLAFGAVFPRKTWF